MKRPVGVILSAVVLLLGSLFVLLGAAAMGFSGAMIQSQLRNGTLPATPGAPPMQPWTPLVIYGMSVFFVALAAWGIATAVGLFRLRRWSRYSTLVIGGGMALIGLVSCLMMLVLMAVPLPTPTTVDPSQAQSIHAATRVVFGGMAIFYAVLAAIGIFWLVYFNRRSVREAFAGIPGRFVENPRPFLITLLSIFSFLGVVSYGALVALPIPGAFFGWLLQGWSKAAIYLPLALLHIAAGVGLWQLKEWGRRIALGLMGFGLALSGFYLFFPATMARYAEQYSRALNPAAPQMPHQFQSTFYPVIFGFNILYMSAIIAVLMYYRYAFEPASTSAPTGTALPPPTEPPTN